MIKLSIFFDLTTATLLKISAFNINKDVFLILKSSEEPFLWATQIKMKHFNKFYSNSMCDNRKNSPQRTHRGLQLVGRHC